MARTTSETMASIVKEKARVFCQEHKCHPFYSEAELASLCQHIERIRSKLTEIQTLPVACDMNRGHDLLIEFAHDHLVLVSHDLADGQDGVSLHVKWSKDL